MKRIKDLSRVFEIERGRSNEAKESDHFLSKLKSNLNHA